MLDNEELNNLIKDRCHFHISNNRFYFNRNDLDEILKNDVVFSYLNDISLKISVSTYDLIKYILTDIEIHNCSVCGKFYSFKERKKKYCSDRCMKQSEKYQHQRNAAYRKNFLEKHGVENPGQLQSVKNKVKNTCLRKYGKEHYLQTEECKDKSKHTCLKKYGKEYYSQTAEWKEKTSNACLEKYGKEFYVQTEKCKNAFFEKHGVYNPWEDEKIIEKIKQTNLEKYGKEHYTQTEEYKERSSKTNIEKYGVKTYLQSDEFKKISKQINLEKYGKQCYKTYEAWNHISTLDFVKPLFSFEDFNGSNGTKYKWKCTKCETVFISEYDNGLPVHVCPNCKEKGISLGEKELDNFCRQYFPSRELNIRSFIHPYEIDIMINEIRLCLEFNGSYWHSIHNVSLNYHLNKTKLCNEKGYRLIHIWEDEWKNNKEEIKQKLIEIFENRETIDFSKRLDRSWFNNLSGSFIEFPPEIIKRQGFDVENCGYILKS